MRGRAAGRVALGRAGGQRRPAGRAALPPRRTPPQPHLELRRCLDLGFRAAQLPDVGLHSWVGHVCKHIAVARGRPSSSAGDTGAGSRGRAHRVHGGSHGMQLVLRTALAGQGSPRFALPAGEGARSQLGPPCELRAVTDSLATAGHDCAVGARAGSCLQRRPGTRGRSDPHDPPAPQGATQAAAGRLRLILCSCYSARRGLHRCNPACWRPGSSLPPPHAPASAPPPASCITAAAARRPAERAAPRGAR
jgi:hypothetical protein